MEDPVDDGGGREKPENGRRSGGWWQRIAICSTTLCLSGIIYWLADYGRHITRSDLDYHQRMVERYVDSKIESFGAVDEAIHKATMTRAFEVGDDLDVERERINRLMERVEQNGRELSRLQGWQPK